MSGAAKPSPRNSAAVRASHSSSYWKSGGSGLRDASSRASSRSRRSSAFKRAPSVSAFSAIASRNARRLAVSIAFLHLAETPLDFLGERRPREPRRPFGARVRRHAVAVEPFRKSPRGPEAKVEQSSRVASSRRKAALGEVAVDGLDERFQASDLHRADLVEFDRVRRFQDALGDLSRARLQRATVSPEDTVLRGEEVARLGRCKGLRVPVRVADHASIVPGASDFPSAFENGRLAASFGNGEHRKALYPAALRSPLTDSNRRPPPYHFGVVATGGNPRQRISLAFAVFADIPFAAGCHQLRPLCSINAPSS